MHHQGPPWPLQILFPAFAIGIGFAWFFFGDRLIDWQIKFLRSRFNRVVTRIMGLVFMVGGCALAWAFATGKLS
jgi:threonine/homoserine/homoserine lactone efflux protein